ncbi:MAG TPA: HEAT repeat domain-containing protein [Deltaproteobacteria bacterium]|nr:HEAT repeat domain-containing protein [Deltaproteobacteria bacterium]HPR54201.1 HEAT repeat domain-containing protein [Deltaproteobacteria bacterium]HXK45888.1 HEAT repeat domain-containing protein [Deltaproteobacteria bacterium]
MAVSEDRPYQTADPAVSKAEAEAAKKVLSGLLLARKNISLYPEGHVVIINAIEQFTRQIELYIRTYGDLRLDVERDHLVSQGEVIFSAPPEEGSLPFTFYRDGIRWLEFTEGIESGELTEFLRIINKYSVLSDEPEGDIVTAFWETQLPHIRYEVVEFFWGAEEEDDSIPFPDIDSVSETVQRESGMTDWEPLPDPPIDMAAIEITLMEKEQIQNMIRIEEEGDPTAYLDALFDSLLQHREQDNFEVILEVLEEEFKGSLARRNFAIALKILRSLQYVLDTSAPEIPWAVPLIEDFVLVISSTQSLSHLQDVWPEIQGEQIETVKEILLLLQPEAIPTLSAILVQNQSMKLRQILMEVIISLASRDMSPLESMIKNPDERLMERLVPVFVSLEGERASNILLKLSRHRSAHVRQEALKGLFQRKGSHMQELFSLIDDQDKAVRSLVLRHMGQTKDRGVEKFLLKYLENPTPACDDHEHVSACFTTLGLCGSTHSIPFLRQALFGRAWLPGSRTAAYREGAALALVRMKIPEARSLLEKASRSLFPGVRRAARKAGGTS